MLSANKTGCGCANPRPSSRLFLHWHLPLAQTWSFPHAALHLQARERQAGWLGRGAWRGTAQRPAERTWLEKHGHRGGAGQGHSRAQETLAFRSGQR